MSDKKDKKKQKKKQDKPNDKQMSEEFVEKYNKLCDEYGLRLVSLPQFRLRDDGTHSVVINQQVAKK